MLPTASLARYDAQHLLEERSWTGLLALLGFFASVIDLRPQLTARCVLQTVVVLKPVLSGKELPPGAPRQEGEVKAVPPRVSRSSVLNLLGQQRQRLCYFA